jgi:hypothetical protein
MVGDQIANQEAKPSKKGGKKDKEKIIIINSSERVELQAVLVLLLL